MPRPHSRVHTAAALLFCCALLAPPLGAFAEGRSEPPPPEPPPEEVPAEPGESPPEEPEIKEEKGLVLPKRLGEYVPEEDRPELVLKVSTDAACAVLIDGKPVAELEAGEEKEVTVKTGKHRLRAVSAEDPAAVWVRDLDLEEGDTPTVTVKMARALLKLRRTERREAVYVSPHTGFMWARRDNGRNIRWRRAGDYCGELRLAGFDDWRLPTLEELDTLTALWSQALYKVLGPVQLSACCPWSSQAESETRAWSVDFRSRKPSLAHVDYSSGLRALCMRVPLPGEESGGGGESDEEGTPEAGEVEDEDGDGNAGSDGSEPASDAGLPAVEEGGDGTGLEAPGRTPSTAGSAS